MPKMVEFWKPDISGETVFPDMSIQVDKNCWKMPKLEKNANETFFGIFKTLCLDVWPKAEDLNLELLGPLYPIW